VVLNLCVLVEAVFGDLDGFDDKILSHFALPNSIFIMETVEEEITALKDLRLSYG